MDAMRKDPKNLAFVRWTADDLAAWEGARGRTRNSSSDSARSPADD